MLRQVTISAILVTGLLVAAVSAQSATKPFTNDDVVTLAKAGLGESTIIAAIRAQDSSFDISAPALLQLKQEGVTINVLGAMVTAMRKRRTAASGPQSDTASVNQQPSATATADMSNQPSSTSQAPAAPTTTKRSWLRAFTAHGAVGQALSSTGSHIADGTGHAGNSIKSAFVSSSSDAGSPSDSLAGSPNQDGATGASAASGTVPANPENFHYMSADGSVMAAENPAQGARQSADM